LDDLEKSLKAAHETFGNESDKLGNIIEDLETRNNNLVEALEGLLNADGGDLQGYKLVEDNDGNGDLCAGYIETAKAVEKAKLIIQMEKTRRGP